MPGADGMDRPLGVRPLRLRPDGGRRVPQVWLVAHITAQTEARFGGVRRLALLFALCGYGSGLLAGLALGSIHRTFNEPNAYVALFFGVIWMPLLIVLAARGEKTT